MDPKDRVIKDKPTGKVRVSHGGRHRGKPYSRTKVKQSEVNNVTRVDDKSFMGKVASYVVPQWLTSWFSGKQEETSTDSDDDREDDDEDDDDAEQQMRQDDQAEPSKETKPHIVSYNHIDQNTQPKTLTSTPMVNTMPFTILSSAVIDSQEGSSRDCHGDSSMEQNMNITVTKSSSKLLSIDENIDYGEHDRSTEGTDREGNGEKKETFPKTRYTFSSGSQPIGAPQKFFTTEHKPSFKVSSFVSSSPLIPCGSSSSFYPGRTSYGGTSSLQGRHVKRQKMSPVASNVPRKTSNIKPKIFSSAKGAVTSDTARKILGALERMSSPVKDASKLPNSPSSVLFKSQRKKGDKSFSLLSSQPNISMPPTRSLNMPQSVSIQFRGKTSEPFKFGTGSIRPNAPVKTFKSHGLPMSFSPDDGYKGGGKMKRQRQISHYSAVEHKGEFEASVNTLPEIHAAAPLLVSSLPKFDFGVSTASKPKQTEFKVSAVESKTEVDSNQKSLGGFTFSQPEIKLASLERNAGAIPKTNYQFSQPTMKEQEDENKKEIIKEDTQQFDFVKKSEDDGLFGKSSATELVKSRKQQSVWGKTCNEKSSDQKSKLAFANKFKTAEGSWECSQCMLVNSAESSVCKACQTKKTCGNESADAKKSSKSNSKAVPMKSLSDKFKKDDGSWECDSCMLENKRDSNECIACGNKRSKEVSKSGSVDKSAALKAKFGSKEGSWECDVCMLQNKATVSECVSCKALKPGVPATPKSVQFSFGTSKQTSGVTFGTDGTSNSIKFGTDDGTSVATEGIFKSSGMGGFNFGLSNQNSGFKYGSNEKAPTINFGTNNSTDFVFGNNQVPAGNTFGTTVGFSFQAPKDRKLEGPSVSVSSSKTEENNNISNTSVVFASSSQKPNDKQPVAPSKDTPKDTAGKEGITSIADAARAGLLKVPEIEKKTSNDLNAVNGPVAGINFSSPKSLMSGSYANEDRLAESSSSVSTSNSFKFSAENSEKDTNLFSFTKPTVSQGQTSTNMGFGFGSSHTFSCKPAEDKSSSCSTNQKKELPPFEKLNSATGIPAKFNFGSKTTFDFNPEGHSSTQSTIQVKDSTLENYKLSTSVTSSTPSPFVFAQSSALRTSDSLFQNPLKTTENKVNFAAPFQFSTEPSKPLSGIFSQHSAFNFQMSEENTSGNSMATEKNIFTSAESNKDTTKNLFGGTSVQKSFTFPSSNMSNASNTFSGGKFSFGTNSSNLSNIFGSQQTQTTELGSNTDFNFATTSAPTSNFLIKPVNSNDEKMKPFNQVAPSAEGQGSSMINFGSTTTGTSGSFNLGAGGTSNTMFSTGQGSSAQPPNRTIKRAVRRKK